MRKKHRIILILVVGGLVGSLVIAASLSAREGVTGHESLGPGLQACMAGENLLIKLGLLPPPNAARNACIANLKQIDGAKATWALEQNKTSNPSVTVLYGTNAYLLEKPWCPDGENYVSGNEHKP